MANIEPHKFKPGAQWPPRSKRFTKLYDQLEAELGGNLSALDAALLTQAVSLMDAAERPSTDVNDRVRCAALAARLIGKIQSALRQRKADHRDPPLREQLAAEATS